MLSAAEAWLFCDDASDAASFSSSTSSYSSSSPSATALACSLMGTRLAGRHLRTMHSTHCKVYQAAAADITTTITENSCGKLSDRDTVCRMAPKNSPLSLVL